MSSPPHKPIVLHISTIQHTLPSVASEIYNALIPSEHVWLSCYRQGEPSVHGKIRLSLDEEDREKINLEGRDGVRLERVDEFDYKGECQQLEVEDVTFVFPKETYVDPVHSDAQYLHQISSFALSPSTHPSTSSNGHAPQNTPSLLATGRADGSLSLYTLPPTSTVSSSELRFSEPSETPITPIFSGRIHKAGVTDVRIVPNSTSSPTHTPALVSSGMDFGVYVSPIPASIVDSAPSTDLKTVKTKDLKSTRLWRGHTKGVNSIIPIQTSPSTSSARQPDFLSIAKDGTLRLWSLSGGQDHQLGVWGSGGFKSINVLAAATDPHTSGISAQEGEQSQAGTSRLKALVWVGLSDGTIEGHDPQLRKSICSLGPPFSTSGSGNAGSLKPVTALAVHASSRWVVSGDAGGLMRLWWVALSEPAEVDAKVEGECVIEWRRNGASVEAIAFLPTVPSSSGDEDHQRLEVVVGTEDGLPYICSISVLEDTKVKVEKEFVFGDVEPVRCVRVLGTASGEREVWMSGDGGVVRRYVV